MNTNEDKTTISLHNPLGRKAWKAIFARGDYFDYNWTKMVSTEVVVKFLENLRIRKGKVRNDEITYRIINHWDSKGLIECHRDKEKGWRLFNLQELTWLSVLKELRNYGLSQSILSRCKNFFFEHVASVEPLSFFEYHFIEMLSKSVPVFFIVLPDGESEFLSYDDLKIAYKLNSLGTNLSIHLNPIVDSLLKRRNISSNFGHDPSLTDEEFNLFFEIQNQDCESITVEKQEGKLKRLKTKKRLPREASSEKLLKKLQVGKLTITKNKGNISNIVEESIKQL